MATITDVHFYCIFLILVFIFALIIRSFSTKTTQRHLSLPPSPPSLPVIGHLHLISAPFHLCLDKLSTKYGPILYIQFGASRQLLISSASLATEIFKTHDTNFASRPPLAFQEELPFTASSFVNSQYGEYWKFMKKLCITKLLGTQAVEASREVRREELRCFLEKIIESASGMKPIDVGLQLTKLTNNITCRTVMSTRCSSEESEAENCRQLVKEIAECFVRTNIGYILGPFKRLGFWLFGKQTINMTRRFDELVEKIFQEHEDKRQKQIGDNEYKDLMDILLDIHYDNQAEYTLTRNEIKTFILEIFAAGTDTTANSMQWALAELINHPHVFNKVREEIYSVVGNSRLVEESDIASLPYLQAVVKEVLRLHPVAPLIPRQSLEHRKVQGFDIPQRTSLIVNIYSVMRDPNAWDDPNEFKPERFFISEENKELLDFYAFGGGRRKCPGTMLAYRLINSTVAAMVQCFNWKIYDYDNGKDTTTVDMQVSKAILHQMAHPLRCLPTIRLNPFASGMISNTASEEN